jgi:outer membrane biosynthesis protein TonB
MQGPRDILIVVLAGVLLAGCAARAKSRTATATPTAPKPAVRNAPPPPPEPLSIPQTQVKLPPPQPVSEAALATVTEPKVVELPEPPAPKPARRPATPAPKTEAQPAAAAPAAPPAPAPELERPRIQELVSPAEQKQLAESLDARKREINQSLQQAGSRASAHDRNLLNRIRSFVKLSEEALARGDYRQADALAERAQILCRELRGAR